MDAETRSEFDRLWREFDHMMAFIAAQFEKAEKRAEERFDRLERRIIELSHRADDHDRALAELAARMDALDQRVGALEERVADGFLAVSDRFSTMHLFLEQLDARLSGRVAEVERRLGDLSLAVREREARGGARVDALAARVDGLAATVDGLAATVDALTRAIAALSERLDAAEVARQGLAREVLARLESVEKELAGLVSRMDGLSEDMLQRFRVVNERLGEIDRRLAA